MKSTLQRLVNFLLGSSKTQGFRLTMIGVGMLISTNLAEAVEPWAVREVVQMVIILAGILGAGLLFFPKSRDRHPD